MRRQSLNYVCVLLCMAAARVLADNAERTLAAADFARHPEFELAQIAPDGAHLALSLRRDDRRAVVILDTATLAVTATVNFNPPNEVADFWWANDQRLVMSLATTLGADDFPVLTGELHAVNADGSHARTLTRANTQGAETRGDAALRGILGFIEGDDDHLLVNVARVRRDRVTAEAARLDIHTGALDRSVRGPSPRAAFVADRGGNVRIAYALDDELAATLFVRDGTPRDGSWRRLAGHGFGQTLRPLVMSPDGLAVDAVDDRAGDTLALTRIATSDGTTTTQLQVPGADIDAVFIDPRTQTLYGARHVGDVPAHLPIGNSHQAAMLKLAAARFDGSYVDVTSFTRDGRYAVVAVDGDRSPRALHLLDATTGAIERMLESRRWLPAERLAPTTTRTLRSRDGLALRMYLTMPLTTKQPSLVVVPHGGPHGIRDDTRFNPFVQLLAHHGYAVLRVNFRGSSGFGRAFRNAGHGQWGDGMLDDIADATRFVLANYPVAADRTCIVGSSYGAYAAIMSAIRESLLYRCAIGSAGFYDVPALLERGDIAASRLGLDYLKRALGDDAKRLRDISPVHRAGELCTPVLLAHGGKDSRAPILHARRLRDALRKHGRNPEYFEVETEGHGFHAEANIRAWYERVINFLDQHARPSQDAANPARQATPGDCRLAAAGVGSAPCCAPQPD